MTEENIKEISQLAIQDVFEQLIVGHLPFAIWRMPNAENVYNCVISTNKEAVWRKIDLEELGSGFAFAPFNYADSNKSLFIQNDLSFSFSSFDDALSQEAEDALASYIDIHIGAKPKKKPQNAFRFILDENTDEKNRFIQNVAKAIKTIKEGFFDKVVLSRQKEIARTEDFSPIKHFIKLSQKYSSVFCSLTYLPWQNEIWMGATPESLVEQDESGIFRTMALAGTQSSTDTDGQEILTADALWRQKEIEEQAFVCRYIINCLKKIRVREFTEIGPKTIKAGNLLHLQTAFEIDTKAIEFPQLGSVMIDLLHPTSAICGMPREAAHTFILETEDYNRSFYSGFLGPVNIQNKTNLFVNLRTLKASSDKITLYAGCGITGDSNPEKEWKETEFKLKTVIA